MDGNSFIKGIYERVINRALEERLDRLEDGLLDIKREPMDLEDSSGALTLHVAKLIAHALSGIKGEDKAKKQAGFCNQLLEVIGRNDAGFKLEGERILDDLKMLLEVRDRRDHLEIPVGDERRYSSYASI